MRSGLTWIVYFIAILFRTRSQDFRSEEFGDYQTDLLEVPATSFRCEDQQWPGYYADVETNCQVFHICVDRISRMDKFSFFCPAGTIFDQELLVCVWPRDFECGTSPSYYRVNELLYGDIYNDISEESGEGKDLNVELFDNRIDDYENDILPQEEIVIDYDNQWSNDRAYQNNRLDTDTRYTDRLSKNDYLSSKNRKAQEHVDFGVHEQQRIVISDTDPLRNTNSHFQTKEVGIKLPAPPKNREIPQNNFKNTEIPQTNVERTEVGGFDLEAGWPTVPDLSKNQDLTSNNRVKQKEPVHNTNNNFFLISDNPDQITITVHDQHRSNNLRGQNRLDSDVRLKNKVRQNNQFNRKSKVTNFANQNNINGAGNEDKIVLNINYDKNKLDTQPQRQEEPTPILNDNEKISNELKILTCFSYNGAENNPQCKMKVSNMKRIKDTGLKKAMENPQIILTDKEHHSDEFLENLAGPNPLAYEDFSDEELSALILNSLTKINNQIAHSVPLNNRQKTSDPFGNSQRRHLVLDDHDLDYIDHETLVVDPSSFNFPKLSNELEGTKIIRNTKPIVHSLKFGDNPNVIIIPNVTQALQDDLPSTLGFPPKSGGSRPNIKSPIVIVSKAEAEENELNQKTVYINTILPDDFNSNLQPPKREEARSQNTNVAPNPNELVYSLPKNHDSPYSENDRTDRFKNSFKFDDLNDEILKVQNFQFKKSITK